MAASDGVDSTWLVNRRGRGQKKVTERSWRRTTKSSLETKDEKRGWTGGKSFVTVCVWSLCWLESWQRPSKLRGRSGGRKGTAVLKTEGGWWWTPLHWDGSPLVGGPWRPGETNYLQDLVVHSRTRMKITANLLETFHTQTVGHVHQCCHAPTRLIISS